MFLTLFLVIRMCVWIFACEYVENRMCICVCMCIYLYICKSMGACGERDMYVYAHACVNIHIFACKYACGEQDVCVCV